ncbi:GNAT family N-acetyltransferase [Chitinophaga barathri]|nr:GNAT family N-acetyltransferase [Chitinophaga barathri]
MNIQTVLENDMVKLVPLEESHFEGLYAVASDPLVWEQHPNKDRYKRDVFKVFFEGAMASGGAYLITDKKTGEIAGSSRYYNLDATNKSIEIGYTFLGRKFWGGGLNHAVKDLMLAHAFEEMDTVIFHIGADNIRSQKAIEKLGAVKTGEVEEAYYGEPACLNFVYQIRKADWPAH